MERRELYLERIDQQFSEEAREIVGDFVNIFRGVGGVVSLKSLPIAGVRRVCLVVSEEAKERIINEVESRKQQNIESGQAKILGSTPVFTEGELAEFGEKLRVLPEEILDIWP